MIRDEAHGKSLQIVFVHELGTQLGNMAGIQCSVPGKANATRREIPDLATEKIAWMHHGDRLGVYFVVALRL